MAMTNSQARVAADSCREAHEILSLAHPDPGYLHKLYLARVRRDAVAASGSTPKALSKAQKRRWAAPKTIEAATRRLAKVRGQATAAAVEVQAVVDQISAYANKQAAIDAAAETQMAAARRKLSTAKGLSTKSRQAALTRRGEALTDATENLLGGMQDVLDVWSSTDPAESFARMDRLRADYGEAGEVARPAYDACIEAADEALAAAEAVLTDTLVRIEAERSTAASKLVAEHEALPKKLERAQSILAKRLVTQDSAERQAKSFGIEVDPDGQVS
jgi:hypothetical protein